MKYGISMEMVDLYRQEPNRNRRECKYFWDELFELVSAAGFKGIELPYELKWDFGGRSGIPFTRRAINIKYAGVKEFLEVLRNKGISCIAGVHFDPTLFAGDNQDVYFGAFEHFASEALGFAIEAECETLTLTPTPPMYLIGKMCTDESSFLKRTAELINRLADTAKKGGVKLCVKNEYWSLLRGEGIKDFMSQLADNTYYGIDTACLAIAGVDPVSFIESCGNRIGSVQLTDTSFVDDGEYYKKPLPEFPAGRATQVFRDLGQGGIDFPAVIKALENAGYNGWVIVNNRQTRDIYRGMLRAVYYLNNVGVKV